MKKSTSERLIDLINSIGINQQQFSERTKIPKSTVSMYFNGKREPRQDILSLIADTFNVSEAWLMGYDVPRERCKQYSDNEAMQMARLSEYALKLSGKIDELSDNKKKDLESYIDYLLSKQDKE